VPNVPIGGVQFLFRHQKNGAFPLNLAHLECLNVLSLVGLPYSCNSIANQFATKEQLKDLTHMFCCQIPCYKLYIKNLFSYVLTLKYMCHFGMDSKKLNLKAKHEIKKKFMVVFWFN
jgi:hypothetical protein